MTSFDLTVRGQWMTLARSFSIWLIAGTAATLVVVTALSAAGVLPWLEVSARFGTTEIPQAGMALQILATLFALCLCFFLPADRRMLRLENSHRDFRITMDDVERAYAAAHAADRDGAFRLKSEFDAVRERIVYLRNHPDLRSLEPSVLEIASQMSEKSRELADVYSREKVERARAFLRQRQEELVAFDEKMALVHETLEELKRWSTRLGVEEDVREKQIDTLEKELFDLLPDLGFEVAMEKIDPMVLEEEVAARKHNVISISPKAGGTGTGAS